MKQTLDNHEVRISGVEKRVDGLEANVSELLKNLNLISVEIGKWGVGLKILLTLCGGVVGFVALVNMVLSIGERMGWM